MIEVDAEPVEDDELGDPFADLPEPAPLALPPPQTKEDLPEVTKESLRKLEDELDLQALAVLGDALHFRDIEPNAEMAPEEWAHLPPAEQKKRLRMAKAAWESKKTAPVGFGMAQAFHSGLQKARAAEKAVTVRTLNVQVAVLSAPIPTFDEIEIEAENG